MRQARPAAMDLGGAFRAPPLPAQAAQKRMLRPALTPWSCVELASWP